MPGGATLHIMIYGHPLHHVHHGHHFHQGQPHHVGPQVMRLHVAQALALRVVEHLQHLVVGFIRSQPIICFQAGYSLQVIVQSARVRLLLALKAFLQGLPVLMDFLLAGAVRCQHLLFEVTELALLLFGKVQCIGHCRKHKGHQGSTMQQVLRYHALMHHAYHLGHHFHHGHHAALHHHRARPHSTGTVWAGHHGMALLLGQGRQGQKGQPQYQSFCKGVHGVVSLGWLHVRDTPNKLPDTVFKTTERWLKSF